MVVINIAIVMFYTFKKLFSFSLKIIHQPGLVLFCCQDSTLKVPDVGYWICRIPIRDILVWYWSSEPQNIFLQRPSCCEKTSLHGEIHIREHKLLLNYCDWNMTMMSWRHKPEVTVLQFQMLLIRAELLCVFDYLIILKCSTIYI